MKYRNAADVLPADLIAAIQRYVQGAYIYIPIKDRKTSNPTEYSIELQKRNERIYTKSLEGVRNKELSNIFSLSESSIRRIIVDQRKRYDEMTERINSILKNWNIEGAKIHQVYDSAWQIGDEYILKVYDDVNMLERNIKIISVLSGMDIPVGRLLENKHGMKFSKDEHHYYILCEKLKGNNIVSLRGSDAIAYEMGKIIASLHTAFLVCEKQDEFWNNSLLDEMKGWIKDTFDSSGWTVVDKHLFEDTTQYLEAVYDALPVQLIHRDVHFGNFLFDNGVFSGYIDFDLSQRNIRIFDLCYFMLGLLSEEEVLKVSEDEWFAILRQVFRGYNESIKLSPQEKEAIPYVMKSIELLFAAWFLEQNDIKCVENAISIFDFVNHNSAKIKKTLLTL